MRSRIEQAAAFLEQDSLEPLTVEAVAAHIGMSPFHFARMFSAALGIAPMAYRRRHLLKRAARQLVLEPHTPITEIAFAAGFDSQQTFARAFRRAFGRTPGQHRRIAVVDIITRPDRFDSGSQIVVQREAEPVDGDAMLLAGIVVTIDGENGKRPRDAWQGLEETLATARKIAGRSIGICWPHHDAGPYDYMAAVELPTAARAPVGFDVRTLPAQRYLVFHQHFEIADFAGQLRRGLEEIWAVQLPQSGHEPSGGPELELYSDELIAGVTAGVLSYWIPIR